MRGAWPVARRRVLVLLIVALRVISACGLARAAGARSAIDPATVAAVEQAIQRVRALGLRHEVTVVEKTADEAEQMISAQMTREHSDEQMEIDGRAGVMLGLYPRGIRLKSQGLSLLKSQLLAFYDFPLHEMVIVEDAPAAAPSAVGGVPADFFHKTVLAHEFTHALQDQNFALGQALKKLDDDSDRQLALTCVSEGDAVIAGLAYASGGIDKGVVNTLTSRMDQVTAAYEAQTAGVPLGLSEPLRLPYTDGVRLVAKAYERGGWDAVDALYRDPPESTQQVIDPALYFDQRRRPVSVRLGGYGRVLSGWHTVDSDTFGELAIAIILRRTLKKGAAVTPLAAQWAGDRVVMLADRRQAVTVLWLIVFRTKPAARRFASVYAKILDRIDGGRTPHRVAYVPGPGAVLVVVGDGARRFDALAPAVLGASAVGEAAQVGR